MLCHGKVEVVTYDVGDVGLGVFVVETNIGNHDYVAACSLHLSGFAREQSDWARDPAYRPDCMCLTVKVFIYSTTIIVYR